MKILQSCCSASWGGLETSALKTVIQLRKRNHELSMLCCAGSTLHNEAVKHGINTFTIRYKINPGAGSILKLKNYLSSAKFDVIHTHLSHDLWLLVPALKLAGINTKLFLSRHMGSGVSKKDFLHKILYNRVRIIISVSNYVRQSVIETCPVGEEKVMVIHPGLELEKYSPAAHNKADIKKSLGLNAESIVIGMASRFSPGKGHEEFLRAAQILKCEFNNTISFLIAGGASYGEEKYRKKILQLSGELGLNDVAKFTGHSSSIAEVLAGMDIFVMPSHEESFGILLTEAMAMELPAAATNNAGIRDIIIDNETGILFPPKDPVELSEALRKLIVNPELRLSLGKAGRKRAEGIFNINRELDTLENIYAG